MRDMSAERGIGWARIVGFVLGVSLAITAVVGWRLSRGTGRLGADVAIAFLQMGELQLSSVTPIINANDLGPGRSAEGSVEVRNSSPSRLSVGVAAEPSISDLDAVLWIDVSAAGKQLFHGTLGDLREGSTRFVISPRQARTLSVRAWLPTDVHGGFEGRIDAVNLTFDPKVVHA
jgi:hypothetical protein